jgi:pimeloyl-ACP methyl ester carboxylesterase
MVAVDYADPGRGSLDLAVIWLRAADQHDRIGSLVLNPGGPGLSGLDYMPLWLSWLPDALLARLWLFRRTFWTLPHPVLPIPDTVTASPVLVIATEADPSTPPSGGVAIARALGSSANLLTVSGGGRTAFGRSPCVAGHVTRYLVELRVPGGRAC